MLSLWQTVWLLKMGHLSRFLNKPKNNGLKIS
ncbi:Uncharacterised protein [Mycobacterium tuberculosis]|nr:Uncharacterised protein [Mycobacterium tuberculosis]